MSKNELEIFDGARDGDDNQLFLIGYGGEDGDYVGRIENEEQAELIVTAVNSHKELVDLLERVVKCNDDVDDVDEFDFQMTNLTADIKDVLDKLKVTKNTL